MHHPKCILARGNEVAPDLAHPPSYADMAGWAADFVWSQLSTAVVVTAQLVHQSVGDRLIPEHLPPLNITAGVKKAMGAVKTARNAAFTLLHH